MLFAVLPPKFDEGGGGGRGGGGVESGGRGVVGAAGVVGVDAVTGVDGAEPGAGILSPAVQDYVSRFESFQEYVGG